MSFRRRMMMAVNSKPYDAEIEYLESTGTQYIDTLISRGDSFESSEYIIDLQFTNTSDRQIQGSGTGFYCGVNNNRWETDYGQYHGTADLNRHIYSKKYRKTNNKSYFYTYLDNTLKYSWYTTYSDDHFGSTIGLFGPSVNAITKCKEKIFAAKILQNNVVVFDGIPVRVGTVGYMYDKVSKQLLGNSGSGNFILGPDKTFNPSNPVPNDEIWYTTTDNSQLSIGTPSGYGANFVSNTYTNGKGVIKFDGDINNIPEDAFSFLRKLQTIALPDSVTAIHGKAFSNCSGLTTIQLGKGLLTMNDNYQGAGGSFTFDDCYNLSKIVSLKSAAATVDNWCFHDFRQVGSTVPCVLAIPSGATRYNNWKYTIVTADTTFYSFTTKTLEESDCLFLNT